MREIANATHAFYDDAKLYFPQWSPDGTRILFQRGVADQSELFTMRADGTDVVRVTNDPDDDYFADWGTAPLVK